MATYHEAPELVPQNQAPEVYHQPQQQQWQNQAVSQTGYETSPVYAQAPPTAYEKQDVVGSPHSQAAAVEGGPPYGAVADDKHRGRTVCGCGIIMFLTVIIALLSVAVIALAAVTGVEAGKASTANNALAAKIASDDNSTATVTVTVTGTGTATGTPTPSPATIIDGGCAANPKGVNGTIYMTPFSNNANFTRYCNADAPNSPLLTVVTTNIEGCMDTCASWNTNANLTVPCDAVSFIPAWLNKTFAIAGHAAGDCFLKPGPVTVGTLTVPNIGTPVDAAILRF